MSYETVNGLFTGIADAIRSVDGTVDPIAHQDMPTKISGIPAAFTDDATATESDILLGKTAYAGGVELTGTCDFNADTSGATLTDNDMLYGVTGYGADGTKLTGTGAYWQYVKRLTGTFYDADIVGDFILTIPNCVSIGPDTFAGNPDMTSLTLNFSTSLTTFNGMFYENGHPVTNLTRITLNGSTENVTTFDPFGVPFVGYHLLETIDGDPLNLASAASIQNTAFWDCDDLVTVSFVSSTIKADLRFRHSPLLSTTSLLSIANGLDGTAVDKTLTMHATATTNIDAIIVDNNAGVAEPGSTMTLTQFINNIKGWTIA